MSAGAGLGRLWLDGSQGQKLSPQLGSLQRLGSSCQAGSGMGEGKRLSFFQHLRVD